VHIIDLLDTIDVPAALDPQHEQTPCDQRHRHRDWIEQIQLDLLDEQQTQHGSR